MIYVNVFLKMSLSLIKLSRFVFLGIFVIIYFLIILLLPKQNLFKKKINQTKQKNTKMNKKLTLHFIFYVTLC